MTDTNIIAPEAHSSIDSSVNLEEKWKTVLSAADSYRTGGHTTNQDAQADRHQHDRDNVKPGAPQAGRSLVEQDAISSGYDGVEDVLWQSALDKFERESRPPTTNSTEDTSKERFDAAGYLDDDHISSPEENQIQTREHQSQNQGQQDPEYTKRMGDMDIIGGMEMDHEQPSSARYGEHTNEFVDDLSLWQTFKVLYKQHPMMKYYILVLLILLIATVAIIGVSVSQNNAPSNNDCITDSYSDKPFLLLPKESQSAGGGGFGTSISASSEYLLVGAPDHACNPQGSQCENLFTTGGGAFLYRLNNKFEWVLYSSFLLDDRVSNGDQFGQSVAISEDSLTVVVGAPKDDKLGIVAGAIYVMEAPFASAAPPIRLVSDDIGFNDGFGGSVSVSATTLGRDSESPIRVTNVVAGASFDDDFGSRSGGVYVFSKFDDNIPDSACGADTSIEAKKWTQCQKLLPDDGETNDLFGKQVDISGRTIVVGAMWDDDKGIDSGAAYVFNLDDDGNWSFQQKLHTINSEPRANRFGVSVATSGDRIVVGADLDDSQGNDSGAAYVFLLSNGAWSVESKLVPATIAGDHRDYTCGFKVDISHDGEMIVVGCPGAPGGGVAYIYNLQESGRWVETNELTAPDGYSGADLLLGHSVTSSGEIPVVGYGKSQGEIFSYKKDCSHP